MKKYETSGFGVMIDMSRNSVMNITSLKSFITILKRMGYNTLMLYTEDTYEVDGEPYFGYFRGRYSKDEMKAIDRFASNLGIEVIPCIQTLAHLNAFLKWGKVPTDCNDILLADNDRVYQLIDNMFKTLSECFTSRKIHIGMDEAYMLGRGKHLDIHGFESIDTIMKRHLGRVTEMAKKYGYSPMLWSDMFFRSWNNGSYRTSKREVPKEALEALPEGVIPVYWDYYSTSKETYDDMFYNHLQFSKDIWFAGGCWSWMGIAPLNQFSLDTMKPALDSCREHGIKNVFMTLWGDDGGECSHFSQLPALFYLIEYAKGNKDDDKIKLKFKQLFGLDFDDFMALDLPNKIPGASGHSNPSKYMLYSDAFCGYLDYTVSEGCGAIYGEYAKVLSAISKKTRKFAYLFKTEAKLCEVLELKYELGVITRKYYAEANKDALSELVKTYTILMKRIKELHKTYREQWMKDNKPYGFDIQDMRFGGLLLRLESCKHRLIDFINGKIDKIDELEEKILPYGKGRI